MKKCTNQNWISLLPPKIFNLSYSNDGRVLLTAEHPTTRSYISIPALARATEAQVREAAKATRPGKSTLLLQIYSSH